MEKDECSTSNQITRREQGNVFFGKLTFHSNSWIAKYKLAAEKIGSIEILGM